MMKPYPQRKLTTDKNIYNYRHRHTRIISKKLFGILANRWRIYFTIVDLKPKTIKDVVLTTLILHNM